MQAGDCLLAVNNNKVECITLEEAVHFLQNEEVVRLKLQKGEVQSELDQLPVVYTVELARHGGPLGLTISGTEGVSDPIVISGLTEGA